MKKFYLTLCAATLSLASFAQMQSTVSKVEMQKFTPVIAKAPDAIEMSASSNIMKSAANNLYYYRPAGSIFCGLTEEGMSYKVTKLCVAPFTNVVFENMSADPSSTSWSVNGNDLSDLVDKNGNLNYGSFGAYTYKGGAYYVPTLSKGNNSFTFGEWNKDGAYLVVDSIESHSFADVAGADGYGWGSMENGYLFGSGKVKSKNRVCFGFETVYDKPMSPLYIENVHGLAVGVDQNPLAEGVTLNLAFYEVLSVDEDGRATLADEPFAVMTATKSDITYLNQSGTSQYSPTGMAYYNNITFSKKGKDIFGNPTQEPVVIDKPFAMVLTGFDQEGVNFGFQGYARPSDDRPWGVTKFLCNDLDDGQTYAHYYQDTQIALSFTGGFDYVDVLDEVQDKAGNKYTDFNQLKVSADGKEITNAGLAAANYALLNTAFDWFDGESGNENYVAELPDWIDNLEVQAGEDGSKYVSVSCSALPDGVKGRGAKLYFTGKGYTSTTPLYVLQGEYTKEEADVSGISVVAANTTKSSNKLFNLAGQQVSKNFKGIVIKDGKKFIIK